jgi:nucleoside-diphosphate-sugar epimerase
MKIIVTGASGFLGSWVCRVLAQSHEVIALVRPTSDLFRLSGINNLKVMPVETKQWPNYILETKPDALVLADWWGVGNKDRNDVRQYENIGRMCELATAAKEAKTATIIGVGSQAELGPVSNDITEELPDQPTTKYGFAKAESRLKLRNILKHSNTRFVWIRIFSTYGPLDTGNWLIPQTVDSLLSREVMKLTKGEQAWSYLHAFDLAKGFQTVLESSSIEGIVNVGNPQTINLKEAVLEIAGNLGAKNLLDFGAVEYRPDQVMKLKPLCEKLTRAGWSPQISFENGISQTISWLKREPSNEIKLDSGEVIEVNLPLRPRT